MTSDVRYASGEVPQVGDVVECVSDDKNLPHGRYTVIGIEPINGYLNVAETGSAIWRFGRFKLIHRAVALSALDTAGVFHHSPQQPAPVETPAPSQPADVPQSKYQWPKAVRQLLEDCAAEAVDVIGNKLPWSRDSLEARFAPHFKPVLAIIARHAGAAPEVAELERLRALESRLQHSVDLDQKDLETIRDGTKMTRAGIVQMLAYGNEEIAKLKAELTTLRERLAGAEAERDEALRKLTSHAPDGHNATNAQVVELMAELAAAKSLLVQAGGTFMVSGFELRPREGKYNIHNLTGIVEGGFADVVAAYMRVKELRAKELAAGKDSAFSS